MRIVIIGPVYPFRGGIAYFSDCLYRELIKKNHQTKLINFNQQYPALLFPGKTQTEECSNFSDIFSTRVLTPYNPFTFKKTLHETLTFRPDVVCFSFFLPYFVPSYLYLIRRLKKKGIRTMILAHNINFHEKWFMSKQLTKRLLNSSNIIMTLSKSVYEDALKLIKSSEVQVIQGFHPLYDFHNQNRYSKESAKEKLGLKNRKVILFFGYIKPYKGVDLLIKSFPLVKEKISDAFLIIAGEIYGNKRYYKELIKQTGLEVDINLQNEYIGSDQVELYYKGADVLVLPYLQATQSGVLQTAYAMDLGVVVTPVGSLPDMVIPGKTGLITESLSENDLAKAIVQYFSLDEGIVKQNIKDHKTNYSWDKFVELLVESL
ncbi:MAG: glycosyltransferase [Candidatus Cloacimonetes bacterium]|nr:glycosyltransferase [Candidatus Cloacimonadota bacterium]